MCVTGGLKDTHTGRQGMENERHVLLFPPPPPIFSSITLSQVLHSSPRAVRPKSGEQMRNKWVLSGTHEGGRYAYQGFSGGLCPTRRSCVFDFLPSSSSSSLPAILSEECGNAVRSGTEGRRKKGDVGRGRIKGRGWSPWVLTGRLSRPTPSS